MRFMSLSLPFMSINPPLIGSSFSRSAFRVIARSVARMVDGNPDWSWSSWDLVCHSIFKCFHLHHLIDSWLDFRGDSKIILFGMTSYIYIWECATSYMCFADYLIQSIILPNYFKIHDCMSPTCVTLSCTNWNPEEVTLYFVRSEAKGSNKRVYRGAMRSAASSNMQQCVWLLVRAPYSS